MDAVCEKFYQEGVEAGRKEAQRRMPWLIAYRVIKRVKISAQEIAELTDIPLADAERLIELAWNPSGVCRDVRLILRILEDQAREDQHSNDGAVQHDEAYWQGYQRALDDVRLRMDSVELDEFFATKNEG